MKKVLEKYFKYHWLLTEYKYVGLVASKKVLALSKALNLQDIVWKPSPFRGLANTIVHKGYICFYAKNPKYRQKAVELDKTKNYITSHLIN